MKVEIEIEDRIDQITLLSPIEYQVYVRVGKGRCTNKELLPERSVKTVASHLESIKKKLNLSTTRNIFIHSFRQQLIRDLSKFEVIKADAVQIGSHWKWRYKLVPKEDKKTA